MYIPFCIKILLILFYFLRCSINHTSMIDLHEMPENDDITTVILGEDRDEHVVQDNESFIGQSFLNEEEAYNIYENFARSTEFSIRKGRFTKHKKNW